MSFLEAKDQKQSDMRSAAIAGGKAMVIGKLLNQLISFGVVLMQTHFLPVWAYGIYGLFIGTIHYINSLGNAGTGEIARRFIPEFAEKGDTRSIARTVRGLVLIRFAVSALILGGILLFYDQIGPVLNIAEYKALFAFFAFGILFTLESHLMFNVYWGLLRQLRYVFTFIIFNIIRFIAFYLVLRNGGGVVGALAVETGSYLLLFLGLYIPFIAEFDINAHTDQPMPTKRMARYGLFMYSSNLGHIFFNTTTDLYVISAMMGKYELGIYAFAVNLGQAIMNWMPDRLIGSVIETITYRNFTREGKEDMLPRYFSKALTLQAFVVVPTAVFLVTFAEPLIANLFDPKFLPSAGLCGGIGVVLAIAAFKFPLNLVATSLEKTRLLFVSQTIFAIYNLVADILLIPLIGLWGAVIATGTSYLFMVSSIWIGLSKKIRLPVETVSIIRICANSAVMGLGFYFIAPRISSVPAFVGAFIGGCVLYLALSYFNCPVDPETRKTIISAMINKKDIEKP